MGKTSGSEISPKRVCANKLQLTKRNLTFLDNVLLQVSNKKTASFIGDTDVTEVEIQLRTAEQVSRFQLFFPNSSWLV